MLKRKIEDTLLQWKNMPNHLPLVIKGVRQCGKTFIVQQFAQQHYESVVYINFVLEADKATAFQGNKDVDTILLGLSTLMPDAKFIPGKTCIILDEIQDCPDARTSLKSFKTDGRFDIIATGSLLGVKGYGDKQKKKKNKKRGKNSVPVGYETIISMCPLDFEEFLWANGIRPEAIDAVRKCFQREVPVPEGVHYAFQQLFYRYIAVGGLPAAINTFLETNHMGEVAAVLKSIIDEYEDDMVKYADDADKPHIRECFESIPAQLAKENKKFQYATIKKGARASQYLGSLQWLEDAGIIHRCYNTEIPELPLDGNAKSEVFKVYPTDIGILMAMFDPGTRADVLQGNLYGYKGAIFEGIMADFLHKKGQNLYYYHKDGGLELDFLIRQKGECVPCEVKSTSNKAKSVKTVLAHPEKYHITQALKFGDYNVGRDGATLTVPSYMGFFLEFDGVEDIDLPILNINEVNRLAGRIFPDE
ncbi:MAG: ATP-binding protein [Bacteroidales bacterium]|nr:ATP-binding protein [Bacteroidales bacterium]